MSTGPVIVAVQLERSESLSGKADMPGVGESMRFISSVCNLLMLVAIGSTEVQKQDDALFGEIGMGLVLLDG